MENENGPSADVVTSGVTLHPASWSWRIDNRFVDNNHHNPIRMTSEAQVEEGAARCASVTLELTLA